MPVICNVMRCSSIECGLHNASLNGWLLGQDDSFKYVKSCVVANGGLRGMWYKEQGKYDMGSFLTSSQFL